MQDDPTPDATSPIRRLTLLQTNDTHGNLEPHLVWSECGPTFPALGGFARIKTLFDRARGNRCNAGVRQRRNVSRHLHGRLDKG